MVAEIIFFAALALLIILLGRRFHLVEQFFAAAKQRTSNLAKSRSIKGSRSFRLKNPLNRPKPASPFLNSSLESEASFWREESPEAARDLLNNYEEGEALVKAGKFQQAEQFFLRMAAKHPSDSKLYARLGLLYLNQKNYSDAIESLKVATKLDRYNPSRHYNLALAYWGNKDVQKAIMSVREAISLDPVTQKYRQLLEQLLNGK